MERITADLKRLYEDMEILLHFYNIKNQLESQRELPKNKRIQEYADIASLTEMQLLYRLDNFLSELPKFPLELTLDDVGEMKILSGFTSVFDAAYYALARFVATQPEVPTKEDGGKPLSVFARVAVRLSLKTATVKNIAMTRNAKKSVIAVNPEQLI